ncbi:MAG: hypothetical protein JW820_05060 [Spirochaetales bacterium]|nr:hypothetical protein [Spirochaetales bacterium]
MKSSKLMEERIRRVRVLFRELGYRVRESERSNDTYSAGFEDEEGMQGGFFIDRASRFLELAYTFSFSPTMSEYLKTRLEEMLKVSYEYGCYINIQTSREEIAFSVFSKIYYSGLNYYCLRDSLREFRFCVQALTDILELSGQSTN